MKDVVSGSFAEFDPNKVIEVINENLKIIYDNRQAEKEAWFLKRHEQGKLVGLWLWKKKVPYDAEELEDWWNHGLTGSWYFESPKYRIWDKWDNTIAAFKKIKDFCQLATDAGNMTVSLSKEDAVFAFNWNV